MFFKYYRANRRPSHIRTRFVFSTFIKSAKKTPESLKMCTLDYKVGIDFVVFIAIGRKKQNYRNMSNILVMNVYAFHRCGNCQSESNISGYLITITAIRNVKTDLQNIFTVVLDVIKKSTNQKI